MRHGSDSSSRSPVRYCSTMKVTRSSKLNRAPSCARRMSGRTRRACSTRIWSFISSPKAIDMSKRPMATKFVVSSGSYITTSAVVIRPESMSISMSPMLISRPVSSLQFFSTYHFVNGDMPNTTAANSSAMNVAIAAVQIIARRARRRPAGRISPLSGAVCRFIIVGNYRCREASISETSSYSV